jgi:hypothetical protein
MRSPTSAMVTAFPAHACFTSTKTAICKRYNEDIDMHDDDDDDDGDDGDDDGDDYDYI